MTRQNQIHRTARQCQQFRKSVIRDGQRSTNSKRSPHHTKKYWREFFRRELNEEMGFE